MQFAQTFQFLNNDTLVKSFKICKKSSFLVIVGLSSFMHYAQLLYACTIFNTNIHAHWRLTTMRKCGIIIKGKQEALAPDAEQRGLRPLPSYPAFSGCLLQNLLLKCSSSWGAILLYCFIAPRLTCGQNTGALKGRGRGLSMINRFSTGRTQKGGLLDADSTRQADKLLMVCWLLRGEAVAVKQVGWLHIPARGMHTPRTHRGRMSKAE